MASESKSSGVDAKTLGKLFDCDERTIRKLASEGIIVRQGRGEYALMPSIRAYVTHLRKQAAARLGQSDEADPVLENALLRRAQRENVDLKNAILRGSVIKVEDIAEGWTRVVRAVRAGILAAPGKIRFELPHLTGHDEEVIDRVLRQALEDAALGDKPPQIDGVDLNAANADAGQPPVRPDDADGDEPTG